MDSGSANYKRYLEGDSEGLRLLIAAYSDGLTGYLYTFVHDPDMAEELMLEAFVKLATKKPKDNGQCGFRTWLYAIGRNIALDYLRKHKNDPAPLEDAETVAGAEDPLESVLKTERNRKLYQCMKRINADYAQGLYLFYFEGMSTREIAKILHRTVHATESMLNRARKSLKDELEKEGFRYEDL